MLTTPDPNLGCATTLEILNELAARLETIEPAILLDRVANPGAPTDPLGVGAGPDEPGLCAALVVLCRLAVAALPADQLHYRTVDA